VRERWEVAVDGVARNAEERERRKKEASARVGIALPSAYRSSAWVFTAGSDLQSVL